MFIGLTKAGTSTAELFSPNEGTTKNFEVDDMVAKLSNSSIGTTAAFHVSRPPKEAIIVLLDTSSSMKLAGFAVPTVDFDVVDHTRSTGDVRVGDMVRDSDGDIGKVVERAGSRVRLKVPGFKKFMGQQSLSMCCPHVVPLHCRYCRALRRSSSSSRPLQIGRWHMICRT